MVGRGFGDESVRQIDWYYLRLFGERFLSGSDDLYSTGIDGFYWRYPPYALYLAGALAVLPLRVAYLVKVLIEGIAIVLSLALLRRSLPRAGHFDVVAILSVSFGAFIFDVMEGQNVASFAAMISLGVFLLSRAKTRRGFASFGLLALKPNLGIAFGLWTIVRRRFGEGAAFVAPGLLFAVLSLPLGLSLWRGFFGGLVGAVEDRGASRPYQVSLLGFLEGVVEGTPWALTLWLIASVLLLSVAVWVWRADAADARKVGVAVLLTLSVNIYGWQQDAVLLVVPAVVCWAMREDYGRWANLAIGSAVAVIWLWFPLFMTYRSLVLGGAITADRLFQYSLVGPTVAVWLLVEGVDVWRQSSVAHLTVDETAK